MFEKLKQLKELKDLQDKLSKEIIDVEKHGIKVTINGKLEFENIVLSNDLDKEKQERFLKDCINEAIKKMQFIIAKKMTGMPGFSL